MAKLGGWVDELGGWVAIAKLGGWVAKKDFLGGNVGSAPACHRGTWVRIKTCLKTQKWTP
jgi:hypothetical protein